MDNELNPYVMVEGISAFRCQGVVWQKDAEQQEKGQEGDYMEVRFILKDNVTESQQQMIDSLNNLCFGIEEAILLNQDEGHL